jgi:hypothetical protein
MILQGYFVRTIRSKKSTFDAIHEHSAHAHSVVESAARYLRKFLRRIRAN